MRLMHQTPLHDRINVELMSMIPSSSRRLVDVGCMQGSLARVWREQHPAAEVIGIDIDADYAELAKQHCTRALAGDIETLDDAAFDSLFPSDCWIFGDCMEHLRDPWAVLRRIRARIDADGCVLICIPNAQHWSVQWRLLSGHFRYEDSGMLDRTHLRWFTRQTLLEMFAETGWAVAQGMTRSIQAPQQEGMLAALARYAQEIGLDGEQARRDALPMWYLFRLTPA